jgi:hypothetical protein
MQISLSTLAILMGLGVSGLQIPGLRNPAGFRKAARAFPRSESWGWALMLLGTGWFLMYLREENISDFAAYKPAMMLGFGAVGIATCLFVRDYLAIRGLAIVLLLLAKLMVDTARDADTPWRLVIVTWAYMMVVAGMWFTVSPWRMRDLILWATETERRIKILSVARLIFGILVVVLGLTVYRGHG